MPTFVFVLYFASSCARSTVVDDAHPLSLAEYRLAMARRVCEQLDRCSRADTWTPGDPDRAYCERSLLDRDPRPEARIAEGRARFDPVAAAECLASFDEQLCVGGGVGACLRVVVGNGQPGDACSLDADCASASCSATPGACGVCAASAAEDEACTLGAAEPLCAPGTFCATAGGSSGTCQPPAAPAQVPVGGPCSYADPSVHSRCGPNLACDPTNRCVARLPRGAVCSTNLDQCALGLRCVPDLDATTRCLPIVLETVPGTGCRVGGAPGAFHECDPRASLACSEVTWTCEPFATLYAFLTPPACAADSECASGLCLGFRCAVRGLDLGLPCSANAECASGHCDDFVCRPIVACP